MHRQLSMLAVVCLFAGCSGESYKLARVSGRVTLNGQPLANASVVFSPLPDGDSSPGPGSAGTTDAAGRYRLVLVGTGPETRGAVVGKHKVSISIATGKDSSEDQPRNGRTKQLPAHYNQATKLECDVSAQGLENADFSLTVP